MADGVLPSTHRINLRDDGAKGQQYPVVLDAGDTVPTNGQSGFAKGAHFIDTNAANDAQWLMNFGTVASCNFDVYQGVRVTDAAAGGQIYGGGDTVPTDGVAGWAPNARFIDTNANSYWSQYQNFGGAITADFDRIQTARDVYGAADGQMFGTGMVVPAGAGWGSGAAFFRACASKTYGFGIFINSGGPITADFVGILTAGDAFPSAGASASKLAAGALHIDTNQAVASASTAWGINTGGPITASYTRVTLA